MSDYIDKKEERYVRYVRCLKTRKIWNSRKTGTICKTSKACKTSKT